MKKNVLILISIMFAFSVHAQEILGEQFCIYYGQPKKITTLTDGVTVVVNFDSNGFVTQKKMGDMKLVYVWDDDYSHAVIKGYSNGEYGGSSNLYLTYANEANGIYRIDYMLDNSSFSIEMEIKGDYTRLKKMVVKEGAFKVTTYNYYENDEASYPYKISLSNDVQSSTIHNKVLVTDRKGNAIYVKQTMGDQTATVDRTIEYYD